MSTINFKLIHKNLILTKWQLDGEIAVVNVYYDEQTKIVYQISEKNNWYRSTENSPLDNPSQYGEWKKLKI